MIMFPHAVNVWLPAFPWANWLLIAVNIAVYVLALLALSKNGGEHALIVEHLVLDGWEMKGALGSALLHVDFSHLLFNMIYLWVFGNAVCAKFGNIKFLLLYFSGAVAAAVMHLLFDGAPALGASGAINAVMGFFVVLYPTNRVYCFYWFIFLYGKFSVGAGWLIFFWFALDLWGAYDGDEESRIAVWAHIGGFIFGVVAAFMSLALNWVQPTRSDHRTLLDIMRGRKSWQR